MKKFLTKLFIAIIIVPGLLSSLNVNVATAQVQTLDPGSAYQANPPTAGSATTPTTAGQKAGDADAKGANGKAEMKTQGCFGTSYGLPVINLDACVANIVYLVMWIFSWFLWIAGKILDMSVYYTLHMSELLKHVPVVDIGWKIFRDLANIMFIFILLWTAISTILGLSSGKTKEIIEHLIIVALLMNFSLFMTKVVIDGSNIIALHFYNLIVTTEQSANGNATQSLVSTLTPTSSFSGAFMEGLKIQTVYDPQTSQGKKLANESGFLGNLGGQVFGEFLNMPKIILIGIFAIVLMMTAAYVFLVAAILFMIRLVVLMMVMILSPLAFLGFVLPSTEHYAEEWLEKLLSQSFFAPIYMALCYVVVKTIQSPAFTSVISVNREDTAMSAVGIFTGNGSASGFAFIFNFILLIGLMVASILVAHKLEAVGVEFADEAGKEARGMIGVGAARGKYIPFATGIYSGVVGKGFGGVVGLFNKDWGASIKQHAASVESKGGHLQKKVDMAEIDRRFGQTKFGKSAIGDFIRSKTTSGSVFGTHAKFGGEEDVHESFEHDVHRRGELEEIQKTETALQLAHNLDGLKESLKAATTKADQTRIKDEIKKAEAAVSGAVGFIAPKAVAEMDEHDIMHLAKYLSLAQIDKVMESEEWTMDEKREILAPKFQSYVDEFGELDRKNEIFEREQRELESKILSGEVLVDGETGQVIDDAKQGQKVDDNTGEIKKLEKNPATGEYDENTGSVIGKVPKSPGMPSHLKAWARNEMGVHGYELLSMLIPSALKSPSLVSVTRHGFTHKELRFNNNITFDTRNELSFIKDRSIRRFTDRKQSGFFAGNTESERKMAYDEALAEAQQVIKSMTDATDEQKQKAWDDAWSKARSKHLQKDLIVEREMRGWASGRSADEVASARSVFRNSPELHAIVDKGIVPKWEGKDSEDIVFLVRDLVKSYKNEMEGKGVMTLENRKALEDILYNPRSRLQLPTLTGSDLRDGVDDAKEVFELQQLLKTLRQKPANSKLDSVISKLKDKNGK